MGLSGRERELDLICCIGGVQRGEAYPANVCTLCICMGFKPMPEPRLEPAPVFAFTPTAPTCGPQAAPKLMLEQNDMFDLRLEL